MSSKKWMKKGTNAVWGWESVVPTALWKESEDL